MESGDLMSLNDKMTGLMNAIRSMSGTTSKLSVDDAMNIASSAGQWGVRVPNLVPKDVQGGSSKVLASEDSTDLYSFYNIYEQQTYSASVYVKNAPENVCLRLFAWNKDWKYVTSDESSFIAKGGSGNLMVKVITPKGMLGPGAIRCSLVLGQKAKNDVTINYKDLMVNKGNYAPYTSSTKSYTVDSLAERLTALENKVGG